MGLLHSLRSALGVVLRRQRFEEGVSDELRFHIDAYAEDLVRSGVAPEDAQRRAQARVREPGSGEGRTARRPRAAAVRRTVAGQPLRRAPVAPRARARRRRRARARRRRQSGGVQRHSRLALPPSAAPGARSARLDLVAQHRERTRAPDGAARLLRHRAPHRVLRPRRRLLSTGVHAHRRRTGGARQRRARQLRHLRGVRRPARPRAWIPPG